MDAEINEKGLKPKFNLEIIYDSEEEAEII